MELEPTIEDYFDDVILSERRTRYDIQDLIIFSLLAAHSIQPKYTDTPTLINGLAQILNHQLLIINRFNRHPSDIKFDPPGGIGGKKGRTSFYNVLMPQLQFYMERRSLAPTMNYIETMCNYARQNIEIVQIVPLRIDPIYRGIALEAIIQEAQWLIEYM
jgi:hypothetical protein